MGLRPLVALLAAAAVVAVACGDDESETSRADMVREVNRICADAHREAQAYTRTRTPPTDAAGVAAAIGETVRISERAVRRLEDVEAPEDDADALEELVDAEKAGLEANRKHKAAAEKGTPDQFKETGDEVLNEARSVKSASEELGVSAASCTRILLPFNVPPPPAGGGGAAGGESVVGTWKGTATQDKPRSTYEMTLTIATLKRGRIAGSIDYPSFPCGGNLRYLRRAGEGFLFRELIRYGTKKCERNGAVTLRRAGSKLSFRWRAFDTSVTATLSPG